MLAIAIFPDGASEIAKKSLWCDSIDYVEWKTGKRTEGISFSVQNFLSKLTGGISLYINGMVLNSLGFKEHFGIKGQPAKFYKYQWPIFILAPAVGMTLFLLTILTINYPKELKEQVERELIERRAAIAASIEKENPSGE